MKTSSMTLRTVRLQPRSNIENVFSIGARVSQIVLAILAAVFALDYAEVILAPISLGVVIGLMFSPIARMLERRGLPPWASGLAIVLLFLIVLFFIGTALSVPMANWVEKAPKMWESLQLHIAEWKTLFDSFSSLRNQIGQIMGQTASMMVKVDDTSTVENVVTLGPTIVAELLLFFASVYFFIATRERFRITVLSICVTRRMRWRIAHFFRDVEILISRYLFTITTVNLALGIAVTLGMWAVGMQSPILWGMLAMIMNYVIYIGPALMTLLLLSISLATRQGEVAIILPPAIYLGLHFIESQFVTAQVLGVTMTMNPFLVFLSLAFWIWLWGPIGGFIAVPALLVIYALMRNTLPMRTE
jgi:predicted PurR-regulated permease PerM